MEIAGRGIAAPGDEVDPRKDRVYFDGTEIKYKDSDEYIMLHKPKGCVCAASDTLGRKTVLDLVGTERRVYPVCKLEYEAEGLVILTTDGEMTHRLTHPRFEIPKTYVVKIEGTLPPQDLAKLRGGVEVDGKTTGKTRVNLLETGKDYARLEITLREGQAQRVRGMLAAVGKEAVFLKCTAIGGLKLGNLGRGMSRKLTAKEVAYLQGF